MREGRTSFRRRLAFDCFCRRWVAPVAVRGSVRFLCVRKCSEERTTEMEEKAIASPAKCGGSPKPMIGKRRPAAKGIPIMLYPIALQEKYEMGGASQKSL